MRHKKLTLNNIKKKKINYIKKPTNMMRLVKII